MAEDIQQLRPPGTFTNTIVGATLASGATIAVTSYLHPVSGTSEIATITPPYSGFSGTVVLIPAGAFTWVNTGNIAVAGTAVANRALFMTYNNGTGKWYPSYVS